LQTKKFDRKEIFVSIDTQLTKLKLKNLGGFGDETRTPNSG
jgi:hypothetical protein